MEAKKAVDNRAKKADQDEIVYVMEYVRNLAGNSTAATNATEIAKLSIDDKPKNNNLLDKNGNVDYSKIKFEPGWTPPPLDIKKRIEELRGCLDPQTPWYLPEYHHINIRAIINLYEEGKIDGTQTTYVKDGKVVSREESLRGPIPGIMEGMAHQYAQKTAYGHGPFGNNFHEIRMLVRLTPAFGGDGTEHGIIVMNDTGSDILTLYTTDLNHLGNSAMYRGWRQPVTLTDANGVVTAFLSIWIQVLLVGNGDVPWRSNWIDETAIVRQPNVPRLSGAGIRNHLYFGTAPGKNYLVIADTKGGLSSLL